MNRVSASLLHAFKLHQQAEFMGPDEFRAQLTGERAFDPERARLGIAFHRIAEHDADIYDEERDVYVVDGLEFDGPASDAVLEPYDPKRGDFELKAADTVIETRHGPVRLVGKADFARGLRGRELKTKAGKDPDWSRYAAGVQWRVYCRIFGLQSITFDLVKLLQRRKTGIWVPHVANGSPLVLYPYPGLDAELDSDVRALVDHVADLGLLDFLRPYWERSDE